MKLDEFINKYINTKVDFDNAFGCQCVDLFREYCKEVLNLPHTGAVEGAKDLILNYSKLPLEKKYFRIEQFGQIGDVVIWNSSSGNKYGHVAIFVSDVEINDILVLEQDGFKQDGVKFKIRSKKNILGYLHKRED